VILKTALFCHKENRPLTSPAHAQNGPDLRTYSIWDEPALSHTKPAFRLALITKLRHRAGDHRDHLVLIGYVKHRMSMQLGKSAIRHDREPGNGVAKADERAPIICSARPDGGRPAGPACDPANPALPSRKASAFNNAVTNRPEQFAFAARGVRPVILSMSGH
jgi:hypothetical protein